MRRLLLFVLIVVFSIDISSAANREKGFRKIIADCDVADVVMSAQTNDQFWLLLQMTNKDYLRVAKSLASKGDHDIKRELVATLQNCNYYFRNVPTREDLYGTSEMIVQNSGLRGANPFAILSITRENDIATFGYPNGYIFMTEGLYNAVGGDESTLQALFAAEAAHYALQHAYGHAKWEKSRRNRSRFWRIFGAVAITTASVVIDNMTDGYNPVIEMGSLMALSLATTDVGPRYTMTYTPRQIYEADIVAYRYMEYLGYGGRAYINALRRVGYDIDAANPQGADCPTMSDRIALLEYLDAHPELRNIVKANKRRPKRVPAYQSLFNFE